MTGDNATRAVNRQAFIDMMGALGSKDFARFETFLDVDVICDWPFPPVVGFPQEMKGAALVRKCFERDMGAFTPYNYKIHTIYDQTDPNLLIAEYAAACTYLPRNVPYANKYLGILRFKAGKVSWWREYLNPMPILDVIGGAQTWSADQGLVRGEGKQA